MGNCLGVITLGQNDDNFGVLCRKRPDAMLPFAGRYRLIDIALSNMVNGGINGVGLFTGNKIRSVMDHVRNGKPWNLDRNSIGIKVYPPLYDNDPLYQKVGDINEFKKNEIFFKDTKADDLVFSTTSMLANIDLEKAYQSFLESDADISLIYKREYQPSPNFIGCKHITCNQNGEVESVGIYTGKSSKVNVFLEMFFIKKKVFFEILDQAIEKGKEVYFHDAMFNSLSNYKVRSYEFDGTVHHINDIKSYYDANMKVLDAEYSKEFFYRNGLIITKPKDEPPSYYSGNAQVKNSYIANGCKIDGRVENSIIFRGVTIGKDTVIKNSIVMQGSTVAQGSRIEYAILDKHVEVKSDVVLIGNPSIPYVVGKDRVVSKDIDHIEDKIVNPMHNKGAQTTEGVIGC